MRWCWASPIPQAGNLSQFNGQYSRPITISDEKKRIREGARTVENRRSYFLDHLKPLRRRRSWFGDSKTMRIAMLSWESLHSIAVGGVAAHVTELAASLERAGHDVHVFTRLAAGQKHYEKIHGVHYHRCPMNLAKDFVDEVNGMCSSFAHHFAGVEDSVGEFDVVHAHDWLAVNAMIWIKQGRGRRGVLTMHSTDYGRSGNVFHGGQSERVRHQERAGTYWADRVIAVSHATREELMWMYEVPGDKIDVVYNGREHASLRG